MAVKGQLDTPTERTCYHCGGKFMSAMPIEKYCATYTGRKCKSQVKYLQTKAATLRRKGVPREKGVKIFHKYHQRPIACESLEDFGSIRIAGCSLPMSHPMMSPFEQDMSRFADKGGYAYV